MEEIEARIPSPPVKRVRALGHGGQRTDTGISIKRVTFASQLCLWDVAPGSLLTFPSFSSFIEKDILPPPPPSPRSPPPPDFSVQIQLANALNALGT